ncbi:ECF transporter S component [uncultured Pseudoramibacter sp.]|uniref:ECF transporter S component n=1 Tax=uncultured Pseudoramibacter sp. TaxID=1623493 RepID=UPI0025E99A6D|nr:ECF transporter S component [uncultured Pseudoramibacter sp.]
MKKQNSSKQKTRWLVTLAMFAAIIVLLAFTPLGLIPLPFIKATTIQIPVVIGAILLGPLAGAILGGVFGICSMVNATVAPTPMSFAFSPALAMNAAGAVKAVWIALGCRICIGIVAGWLWRGLKKVKMNDIPALAITGAAGAMTNTALVMGSIYLLLAQEYAKSIGSSMSAVFKVIMGVVAGNGIPEAIVTAILVTVIGKALLALTKRSAK